MKEEDRGGVLMRGIGRWLVYSRPRAWLGMAVHAEERFRVFDLRLVHRSNALHFEERKTAPRVEHVNHSPGDVRKMVAVARVGRQCVASPRRWHRCECSYRNWRHL